MRFSQIFLKMTYNAVVKVYKVVRCDANDDRTVIAILELMFRKE